MANNNTPLELKPPRINKIVIEGERIYTLFVNNIIKKYDISPLLKKETYFKLRNPSYLKTGKIDSGGYGISWDDDCDLSENELWINGASITDEKELARLEFLFEISTPTHEQKNS